MRLTRFGQPVIGKFFSPYNILFPPFNRYSKLEKADLLELTVNYLKQYNAAVNAAMSEPEVLANYYSGYAEGIQVIDKFMAGQIRQGNVNAEFQGRVKSHLQSCAPQNPNEKKTRAEEDMQSRKRKSPSPIRADQVNFYLVFCRA